MTFDSVNAILVIGGGKMGAALIKGWLDAGLASERVHVVEPDGQRHHDLRAIGCTKIAANAQALPQDLTPDIALIAIKPQVFDQVLPDFRPFIADRTMVISIAAGRSIQSLATLLGSAQPIVRSMPNTPASIGRGTTVLCANGKVSTEQKAVATSLMEAVGQAFWIESEDLMHGVTALSGGGPAYVFLLVETLARAGADLGLPNDLAMRLARGTVAGAGELLHQRDKPAAVLRAEVTSPGGTTQAALKILMADHGLQELCTKALAHADQRSRELA